MKLIVVLIAALVYKNWVGANPLSEKFSLTTWYSWVKALGFVKSQPAWVALIICVGAPVIVMGIISLVFSELIVVLVFHLIALLLLVYAMADFPLRDQLDHFLDRLQESDAEGNSSALIEEKDHQKETLIYRTFEVFFATVGWYVILGPVGLLIYVLVKEYHLMEEESHQLSDRIIYFLDWIPSRVTCLLFSVTGNFVDTFAAWLESLFKWDEDIKDTLVKSAQCAVSVKPPAAEDKETLIADVEMELSEVDLLLNRTLWAWVGVAALITILRL